MPKIKTIRFKQTSQSGEALEFSSDITCATDGEFAATIPDVLAATAGALSATPEWRPHIRINKARINQRVEGLILEKIEHFIAAAIKDFLAVTVTRERVILYTHSNYTTFSRATDGSIHPNGHFAGDGAKWYDNNISAQTAPRQFSVGLAACVRDKITYTRPSGSRVVYEAPSGEGESHWDVNPMNRLNAFIMQKLNGPANSAVHEMPYSDRAADFFADMILAMCRLGEQLDQFVGNDELLQLAIQRGPLALGFSNQTTPERQS